MATVETYLPLYRKYRPQSFADVMGQEAIRQTLGNAIQLGKVAHAYLLCGPRGTGKTSMARIFAKSLNCEQGPTLTPCQVCPSCLGITAGNALDVIEFDAASNNKVDDARELIENCQFTPMAGKYKIYIIDEVHMLTSQAFNALLKTLEEPPPNVVFIFATTEAHKVLPTIISRCQRFDFSRITRQDIIKRLAYISQQEEIAIDAQALDAIARHVRGGMRDALGLLDQVAVIARSQPGKVISQEDVTLFIGALEEDILIWMSQAIASRQADVLLQQIGELERRGIEPVQIVKELTAHYRHLFFVASANRNPRQQVTAEQLDLPEAYFEKLQEQVSAYALEELPQILSRLASIERNIRNTQQSQLWLEVGLLELAHRHEIHAIDNLVKRLEALEQKLQGAQPIAQVPQQAVQPAKYSAPVSQATQAPPARIPVQQTAVANASMTQHAAASESASSMTAVLPPKIDETVESPVLSVSSGQSLSAQSSVMQTIPESPVHSIQPHTPAAVSASPVATRDVSGSPLAELYQRICQQVASSTTRDLLVQQTFAIANEGANLTIGCVSEPILTIVKNPRKFIHLQKAADVVLGQTANIQLVLDKNMLARSGGSSPPKLSGAAPQAVAVPVVEKAEIPPAKPFADAGISTQTVTSKLTTLQKTPENIPSERPEAEFSTSVSSQDETPPRVSSVRAIESTSYQFQPFDDDAPPLEDDEPPIGMDEIGSDLVVSAFSKNTLPEMTLLASSSLPEGSLGKKMAESVTAADMEAHHLQEARRYTVQLLQGRLLE